MPKAARLFGRHRLLCSRHDGRAVSSRHLSIMGRFWQAGGEVLPVETILFALMRDAADPRFKELLKLVK